MITREQVKKTYELAMLELPEEQVDEMTEKFQIIYDLAARVDEVDTEGLEDMVSPVTHSCPLRDDVPEASLDREAALLNTHDREFGYFRLKSVMLEEEDV